MFVNDKLIFIQLEKTGCTHVKRLLQHFLGGTQHNKHSRIPEEFETNGRLIVGSVRNPWDWYVSMWSYGCLKQGSLYDDLTAPVKLRGLGYRTEPFTALRRLFNEFSRKRRDWGSIYTDARDPELFRRWLKAIHEPNYRYDLMDDYAKSPISLHSGFLTYRFGRLYLKNLDSLFAPSTSSYVQLQSVFESHIQPGFFVRNEFLEDDLIKLLELCGSKLQQADVDFIYSTYKTNASQRERNLEYYYDRETIDLILRRDRIIVEKFGYNPPKLQ